MAKSRLINTCFWSDTYIQELTPENKLIFLFLLTNEKTEICGIYEISKKSIAFGTGLSIDTVSEAIARLCIDKKINYVDGWVWIRNFTKHQQRNPKVIAGIDRGLSCVPKDILDRLYIDYDRDSHFNSNFNFNFNFNSNLTNNEFLSSRTEKNVQKSKILEEQAKKIFESLNEGSENKLPKTVLSEIQALIETHTIEVVELVVQKIKGHRLYHNPDGRWFTFVNFCKSEFANKEVKNAKEQREINAVRNYSVSKIKI